MTIAAANPETPNAVARQGALLFSGFAAAQAMSFVRNAMIGHGLAKGDFGIAATITLVLQLVETLSDLGSDRLIVQDKDGDSEDFVATAHTVLLARGALIGLVLYAIAPLLASFFKIADATWAFQLAALAPVIKGFMHLDCRRAQRRLDNRPQLLVEILPQATALALTLPAVWWTQDYAAVVWLSLAQAITAVIVSHSLAVRPYRLARDQAILARQIAFGWPILVSALPLIAVYQGDRIIIGRLSGMEDLASYSAAFMVTMVPGLIAAKVGHALMLPMFAGVIRRGGKLRGRFAVMAEATTLAAGLYLALFTVAGDWLLPAFFGRNYHGLAAVTAWLAAMWSLRMVQAVPGMALMAAGETKPFIAAGFIRAGALPVAAWAAYSGARIDAIAAIGTVAEACSLIYVAWRLQRLEAGLGTLLLSRAAFLVPVAVAACLARCAAGTNMTAALVGGCGIVMAIAGIGLAVMPSLRAHFRRALAPIMGQVAV
jgi:O-antigen/teichoic acid export membrane protein